LPPSGDPFLTPKPKFSRRQLSIRAIPFVEVVSGASVPPEREDPTMSASTATFTASAPSKRRSWALPRATAVIGLAAAAVVTALAGLLHAADVSFEIDGETIPLLGFAQMTFVGAVVGGLILAGLNRWSAAPRRRFLQIAVALTALSCVPSVTMPDDVATQIALVALHLLAAALIVPVLFRHAHD
jgi:Family of unknown function (DUF6069)